MSPTTRIRRAGATLPDRSSPLPLWAQVYDDLRRRIDAEEFPDTFPGEIALTEQYEVSRHTIREALRVLRDEGIVRSERGRASTVETATFSQNLGTLYSLFRTIDDRGVRQHSVVKRQTVTTNTSVAEKLGLRSNAKLVVIERVRVADGEPLAHDTAWLPWKLAQKLLKSDVAQQGLYDALATDCGIVVDSGRESISASLAPAHIARLLRLPAGVAVHYIERLAFAGAEPVEWRETYIRGDRFALEAQWDRQDSTVIPVADAHKEKS